MKSDSWLTPKWILAPLGKFDTDPCIPRGLPHHLRAAFQCYSIVEDGLKRSWAGRVWLNPPFGNQWQEWLNKLADHGNGIALIAARTETEAFFRLVWKEAHAVLFIKGRPHFHAGVPMEIKRKKKPTIHLKVGEKAPFNSGAPICLVAYGRSNAETLRTCGLGHFVFLKP
jgi:hypothetical protein